MQKFEFEGQRPNETVLLAKRQHPWVLSKLGLLILVIILINIVLIKFFGLSTVTSISLTASAIIIALAVFIRWFTFNNDIFILTDQRVINLDQTNLFFKRASETELKDIVNVTYEIKGIAKTILNFGDVQLSGVGDEISTIILKNVENPHFIHDKIISARQSGGREFDIKEKPEKVVIR